MKVPEDAIEAAAKADHERWRHPNAPVWDDADEGVRELWRDTERVPLEAAAKYLTANELDIMADHLAGQDDGRDGGYQHAGRDIIRQIRARADQIRGAS